MPSGISNFQIEEAIKKKTKKKTMTTSKITLLEYFQASK